jgi:hypothetical protein
MDRVNSNLDTTEHYYSQQASQPETGQTSAGVPANGAPGQPQSYLNPNLPVFTRGEHGILTAPPQPTPLEDIRQNDALVELFNSQPAKKRKRRCRAELKEQFLAGLEAFERGALLKNCSATVPFYEYIKTDGSLIKKGVSLYKTLTAAEKMRLDQAIAARQGAKHKWVPDSLLQIPSSPRPDLEYLLHPQPIAAEDFIHSQIHQEDGQHTSQPETGHASAGVLANGALESPPAPGQLYLNPNMPALIPSSPEADMEYLLRTSQPTPLENIVQKDVPQELPNPQPAKKRQRRSSAEVKKQFLAGLKAFGQGALLKDCSATLPFYDYITNDGSLIRRGIPLYKKLTEAEKTRLDQAIAARRGAKPKWVADSLPQTTPPPRTDRECFLSRSAQPIEEEGNIQNDAPPELPNPQSTVKARRRRSSAEVKEQFLASLEAFGQGALLRDCSSSLPFREYIKTDGSLIKKGFSLYNTLTAAEKTQLDQAIAARQGARPIRMGEDLVKESFLAGLDNYAQGVQLKDCSATLQFSAYVSDDGHLKQTGQNLRDSLPPEDRERVNQALLSRRVFYLARLVSNDTVEGRFLAGLDKYAQGALIKDCSATLDFGRYASHKGILTDLGRSLCDSLSQEGQVRVNQALISRRRIYFDRLATNETLEERFLASLDNYAGGALLSECSRDIALYKYVTTDGDLTPLGESLCDRLDMEGKMRVNQALAARITQRTSRDVDQFMATLEPYGNGQALLECGNQSGLKMKAITYLTPEGGLTPRGKLLIKNLQPDQLNKVLEAIEKRQQCTELNR